MRRTVGIASNLSDPHECCILLRPCPPLQQVMSPAASLANLESSAPGATTLGGLEEGSLPPFAPSPSYGLPPWLAHWRLRLGLASEVRDGGWLAACLREGCPGISRLGARCCFNWCTEEEGLGGARSVGITLRPFVPPSGAVLRPVARAERGGRALLRRLRPAAARLAAQLRRGRRAAVAGRPAERAERSGAVPLPVPHRPAVRSSYGLVEACCMAGFGVAAHLAIDSHWAAFSMCWQPSQQP